MVISQEDLQTISEYAQRIFEGIPRPGRLYGAEVWALMAHDGIAIRQNSYSGEYVSWITAKYALGTPEARRFAIGIRWDEDDLESGEYRRFVRTRIERAVHCFEDFAEEYEEGGLLLPEPKVGRPFPPLRKKVQERAA